MARQTFKTLLTLSISALAITATGGCETTQIETKNVVCAAMDVRTKCLLERANASLSEITDPFDWTTSANELAIAYDATGQSQTSYELIGKAVDRLADIEDEKRRDTATSEISLALSKLTASSIGLNLVDRLAAIEVSSADKEADINAKLVTARGVHGNLSNAAILSKALPGVTDSEDAYRGRTIREIAALMAKSGQYEEAIELARTIDVRFNYYKGIALTDIMAVAAKDGRTDIVLDLTPEAEAVAVSQKNGYFGAGILRDIAYALIVTGNTSTARDYVERAKSSAKNAPKLQEQARSLSRVMTRMADARWTEDSAPDLEEALSLARQEPSAIMQPYALYEIAGSAAFVGDIGLAKSLLEDIPTTPFGSASSLRAAVQRDLAWGMVRSGQVSDGVQLADSIEAPRERIHALSRIVRLQLNPKMDALPRYL